MKLKASRNLRRKQRPPYGAFAQIALGRRPKALPRKTVERSHAMNTEEKTKPFADLFEQATRNYEQAVKTGLKAQEESAKLWTNLCNQITGPADLQKRVKAFADEVIPQTQKNLNEYLKLVEQNSRATVELVKKAVATSQATSPQDAQSKFLALWETTLGVVRETAQSVTQANTKAVESCLEILRKAGEPIQTGQAQAKA
jgi:hypothetical protein